jgi:hypothetical protein
MGEVRLAQHDACALIRAEGGVVDKNALILHIRHGEGLGFLGWWRGIVIGGGRTGAATFRQASDQN